MTPRLQGPSLLLPWYSTEDEDRRFVKILRNTAIAFLVLFVAVYFYPVAEKNRQQNEALPPTLARVLLEQQALPKVSPPKLQQLEQKKPEAKTPQPKPQKPASKPQVKPEPKPKPPAVKQPAANTPKPRSQQAKPQKTAAQKRQEAKDQAASSGLLQFQDELAAMRDSVDLSAVDNHNLRRGESQAKIQDRAVISRRASAASGGITTADLSRNTGGIALSGRETTRVSSDLAQKQRAAAATARKTTTADGRQAVTRSEQAIRKVLDSNLAAVDTLYQRALRKNPALEGLFEFKLVVAPDGSISAVRIINSELDDDALEKKLLARIRLINFGAADVAATTVNYTFKFYPR
ncbi:MAG: AgmX/PglI C-terminal domain-containing protein [Cellvibrionaceae bacterium]|nr:AgmX/PglI C-terminal domain-containing protein [Cellvibrionaceae bacterium]